jgi:hypothetical protein
MNKRLLPALLISLASHQKVAISLGCQIAKARIANDGRFTIGLKPKARNRGPQALAFGLLKPKALLGAVAPVYVD